VATAIADSNAAPNDREGEIDSIDQAIEAD
jgi:hypothetical protein